MCRNEVPPSVSSFVIDNEGNGNHYCYTCIESEFMMCDVCNFYVQNESTIQYTGRVFCNRCSQSIYTCSGCNRPTHVSDIELDNGRETLCGRCARNNYICNRCGVLESRDFHIRGQELCVSCQEESVIRPYNYRPRRFNYYEMHPLDDNIYLGVEVEIDGAGENNPNARAVLKALGGHDYVYITHDGTLRNGFEAVSHPMTLQYHKREMPWKDAFKVAKQLGYKAHDAETCGLHVHIDRQAFGPNEEYQERNIAFLMYLVEKFWNGFVFFSRRTPSQLSEFARRYLNYEEVEDMDAMSPRYVLRKAKDVWSKYFAVNITNRRTVELRIFRGTLRYKTFIATLEFVHGLVRYVTQSDMTDAQLASWDDFVKWLSSRYENIEEHFKYLDERERRKKKGEMPAYDTDEDTEQQDLEERIYNSYYCRRCDNHIPENRVTRSISRAHCPDCGAFVRRGRNFDNISSIWDEPRFEPRSDEPNPFVDDSNPFTPFV